MVPFNFYENQKLNVQKVPGQLANIYFDSFYKTECVKVQMLYRATFILNADLPDTVIKSNLGI